MGLRAARPSPRSLTVRYCIALLTICVAADSTLPSEGERWESSRGRRAPAPMPVPAIWLLLEGGVSWLSSQASAECACPSCAWARPHEAGAPWCRAAGCMEAGGSEGGVLLGPTAGAPADRDTSGERSCGVIVPPALLATEWAGEGAVPGADGRDEVEMMAADGTDSQRQMLSPSHLLKLHEGGDYCFHLVLRRPAWRAWDLSGCGGEPGWSSWMELHAEN